MSYLTAVPGALWRLCVPGVYRVPHFDEGGYHQLVAVGENHRVLDHVRVFNVNEEVRYGRYLRHEYGLSIGDKQCRQCGGWFTPSSSRHVRCQDCRERRKDHSLDGGL